MRDNVAPAAVVITSPSVNPYASGDTLFTLSGTCETAASVTLAGAQSGAATCMNGTFQFDIGKSQNGTYDYMLAQRDRAGNTSLPRAFRWQRDASIPPTPVLSSPLVNPYIASGSNLTVAGSCMGTNPVRIRGDAVADATCASGAFSMSINAASDGTYAFQATQPAPSTAPRRPRCRSSGPAPRPPRRRLRASCALLSDRVRRSTRIASRCPSFGAQGRFLLCSELLVELQGLPLRHVACAMHVEVDDLGVDLALDQCAVDLMPVVLPHLLSC